MDLLQLYYESDDEQQDGDGDEQQHQDKKNDNNNDDELIIAVEEQEEGVLLEGIGGTDDNGVGGSVSTNSSNSTAPAPSSTTSTRKRKHPQNQNNNNQHDHVLFVRSQPHVRGNWSGHVYIEIPISHDKLQQRLDEAMELLNNAHQNNQQQQQEKEKIWIRHESPLHLSLSRPFYLQRGNIDSFMSALRKQMQFVASFTIRVYITTTDGQQQQQQQQQQPRFLTNDDNTRIFATWDVTSPPPPPPIRNSASNNNNNNKDTLTRLVQDHIDPVLRMYNQPTYYENPQFHVSYASLSSSPSAKAVAGVEAGTTNGSSMTTTKPTTKEATTTIATTAQTCCCFQVPVTSIHCTFGTTLQYNIPLMLSTSSSDG